MVEFVRTPEERFKNIPNFMKYLIQFEIYSKIKNINGKKYGRQTKFCYYYA